MKYNITTELEKLGIKPTLKASDFLRFSVNGYEVNYIEEERESLAFLSNTEKSSLYSKIEFTAPEEEKHVYMLRISSGVGPKEIAEWVYRKMQHPKRDTSKLEDFKKRIKALGYDWLVSERVMKVSPELEDYGKLKIDTLAIYYNDIISDDHMLVQIKTLLDQPGQPQLLLLKNITFLDRVTMSEEEFKEENLENVVKKTMMFKYLELGESAEGGEENRIRERSEKL